MKLFNSVEASLPQTLMKTQKQKIGMIGENIAVKHLVKHGYKIIERNYLKKWGEIDVIAKQNNVLRFIEVKSRNVSYETFGESEPKTDLFIKPVRPTSQNDWFRPEENVHPWKRKRLSRAIRTYLAERQIPEDQEFQIDVIAVFIDLTNKKAKLRITENIIL